MIQKFTVCLMICLTCLLVSSFNEEALSPPDKSSCTADKAGGAAEVTFTTQTVAKDKYTNAGMRSAVSQSQSVSRKQNS